MSFPRPHQPVRREQSISTSTRCVSLGLLAFSCQLRPPFLALGRCLNPWSRASVSTTTVATAVPGKAPLDGVVPLCPFRDPTWECRGAEVLAQHSLPLCPWGQSCALCRQVGESLSSALLSVTKASLFTEILWKDLLHFATYSFSF